MAGELAFSPTELAAMQAVQEAHMMDMGTIDLYTDAGADEYGNPNPSWPAGVVTACGYEPVKPEEGMDNAQVPLFDARLRLPLSSVISSQDRFTLFQRHGVAITPITHEVIGEPKRGPSGLWCELKVVTDGS